MYSQALKQTVSSGLLSFPITDFDESGNFAPASYTRRLEWLAPFGASALFVGGGTGEGFSLTPAEHEDVVRIAVAACGKEVPIHTERGLPRRWRVMPKRTVLPGCFCCHII